MPAANEQHTKSHSVSLGIRETQNVQLPAVFVLYAKRYWREAKNRKECALPGLWKQVCPPHPDLVKPPAVLPPCPGGSSAPQMPP